MPKGVLSGIEISEAVQRQREYTSLRKMLYDVNCPERDIDPWISLFHPGSWLRYQWLKRQPRVYLEGFNAKPSDLGGSLNPNSYNLNLADELLVYNVPTIKPEVRFSPILREQDWEPYALDVKKDNPTKRLTIPPGGIILKPDRLYLGRTVQYTESYNLVPRLDGRSSIGRLGICIHITAAFGDVGYCGTWTTEMTVIHPVRIYPGMSICQISYAPITSGGRQYAGKYQNARGVASSRFHLGDGYKMAPTSNRS
jgi:dCTP deaminase